MPATPPGVDAPLVAGNPYRKRHWWRWALGGLIATVLVLFLAGVAFIKLQSSSPPLTLPTGPSITPSGPLQGSWAATSGSLAGFRVKESSLGISNDVVGRTGAVRGTVVISHNQVTTATFRVDLRTVKVGGRTERTFDNSLGTSAHPYATVTLTSPITLNDALVSGATTTTSATAELTIHGVTHPVRITFSSRRDGPALQAAGSIPVDFSQWGIITPNSYGPVGSLADHGTAEFILELRRK